MTAAGRARVIEWAFRISLLGKAVLGALQTLAGFALWLTPGTAIAGLAGFLTRHELAEDPNDPLARKIIDMAAAIDPTASHFYVVYLLGHGLIHVAVVLSLLLKWRIAYPFSLSALIAFVVYQLWKYSQVPDAMILILTAIDIAVIAIVLLEHRLTKRA